MKIEKLSDTQIRCTLNKSDLASRQLKISELAYGSEKAKDLFRDMMQQASYEFGFEAEDIPLMIEAIPVSADCIVLVITKVEDPEELDTRFSKFAPELSDDEIDLPYDDDNEQLLPDNNVQEDNGADDVINLFNKVKDYLNKAVADVEEPNDSQFIPFNKTLKETSAPSNKPADISSSTSTANENNNINVTINVTRVFSFDSLDTVNKVAHILGTIYCGTNSLYKDEDSLRYYLVLEKGDYSPAIFNKICNILTEYGKRENFSYAVVSYFKEHYTTIISNNALQILSDI